MGSFRLTTTEGVSTLVVTGDVTPEEWAEIAREASAAVRAAAPLLIDIRGARSRGLSYRDTYGLAQAFVHHFDARCGRVAVLDGYDDLFEKTQFFEATTTARGMEVRAFVHQTAALEWLRLGGAPGASP